MGLALFSATTRADSLCRGFRQFATTHFRYQRFVGDFSGSQRGEWDDIRLVNDYSLRFVPTGSRDGRRRSAARFELRPGDRSLVSGFRAELKDNYIPETGDTVWYGLSTRVPADFPTDTDSSFVITQWLNRKMPNRPEAEIRPPLAARYLKGRLDITLITKVGGEIKKIVLYSEPNFAKEAWHDFVYQVKWTSKDDGFIRVWKNGKQIVDYKGRTEYDDIEGPFFKMGLYNWEDVDRNYVIYHRDYRRGNSFQAVDPSVERPQGLQ